MKALHYIFEKKQIGRCSRTPANCRQQRGTEREKERQREREREKERERERERETEREQKRKREELPLC